MKKSKHIYYSIFFCCLVVASFGATVSATLFQNYKVIVSSSTCKNSKSTLQTNKETTHNEFLNDETETDYEYDCFEPFPHRSHFKFEKLRTRFVSFHSLVKSPKSPIYLSDCSLRI